MGQIGSVQDKPGFGDESSRSYSTVVNDHDKILFVGSTGVGKSTLVRSLMGCSESMRVNQDGMIALMWASRHGHVEFVKELLVKGVDCSVQDKDGKSPLMLASQNGHEEVVKMLLSAGAEVDLKDKNGDTALHKAAERGHFRCVQILLSTPGINAKIVNNKGQTPLQLLQCVATGLKVKSLLAEFCRILYREIIKITEYFSMFTNETAIDKMQIIAEFCRILYRDIIKITEYFSMFTNETAIDKPPDRIKGRNSYMYKFMQAGISSHSKANRTIYDLAGHKEYYSSHSKANRTMYDLAGHKEYYSSHSKANRTKYDLAGHKEYYSSHSKADRTIHDLAGHKKYYSSHSFILELISNVTPLVFLLMASLMLTLKDITAQVYYWLAMIGNVCNKCPQRSSISLSLSPAWKGSKQVLIVFCLILHAEADGVVISPSSDYTTFENSVSTFTFNCSGNGIFLFWMVDGLDTGTHSILSRGIHYTPYVSSQDGLTVSSQLIVPTTKANNNTTVVCNVLDSLFYPQSSDPVKLILQENASIAFSNATEIGTQNSDTVIGAAVGGVLTIFVFGIVIICLCCICKCKGITQMSQEENNVGSKKIGSSFG